MPVLAISWFHFQTTYLTDSLATDSRFALWTELFKLLATLGFVQVEDFPPGILDSVVIHDVCIGRPPYVRIHYIDLYNRIAIVVALRLLSRFVSCKECK